MPEAIDPIASKDALRGEGFVGAAKLDIRYMNIESGGRAGAAHPAGVVSLSRHPKFASRSAAVDYVRSLPPEFEGSFLAIFLDRDFNLLALDRLGEGNVTQCGVRPTDLVGRAARLGAAGFILIHRALERWSGGSSEEYRITREIRRAGEDHEIHLLDHLILTGDRLIDISL